MKEELNLNQTPVSSDGIERPRYSLAQAARFVRISPTTLRAWVRGRTYETTGGPQTSLPLISLPIPNDPRLSFSNLVECHVLRSLRTRHEVPMSDVRTALGYAEKKFRIKRLLLSDELRTAAGRVFIEHLGHLIDLGHSGQIVLRELLEGHLQRIERDPLGLPFRLFPVNTARGLDGPRIVTIDPRISFGRPFIAGKGVRTSTIIERLDAGETREVIATDYSLTAQEIDEAILYEKAA